MPAVRTLQPTTRGAAGRLFHAFANALLERTLPTLREWLKGKLGEGASVESMELDGARVHLRGVALPIGPTAVLEVTQATFLGSVGDLAVGVPPLRMESLVGRLVVQGEDGEQRFCAPLTFEGREPPTGTEWIHGVVTVTGATWSASVGDIDEQSPLSGTITLSVTSSEWRLREGALRVADAQIEIEGAGRLDDPARGLERARLRANDARVGHFIDGLAALAGRTLRLAVPLPWTGRCEGTIEVEGDRVSASFDVRTEGSTLHVEGNGSREGTIEAARISGTLAWPDLVPASILDLFEESEPVSIEGRVSGAFDALEGELRVSCEALVFAHLREPARLVALVKLGGEHVAEAHAEVAFLRRAGTITIDGTLDHRGVLAGRLGGEIDPSVVDLGVGVSSGDRVRITGTLGGGLRAPQVRAEARAERLGYRRGDAQVELEAVALDVEWSEALQISVRARVGSGTIALDPRAKTATVARIDAESAVALLRVAGVDWVRLGSESEALAMFAIPDDAEIDAQLAFHDGVRGEVHLATPRSRISVEPLVYSGGVLDGSVLRGRLAAQDGLTAGLFPGPVKPRPEGAVDLELAMFGWGADTYVEGRLVTASLTWIFFDGTPGVMLVAAACGLRVDGQAVTLTGLEGNVFGGRIELTMRIAYPDARGPSTPTGRLLISGAREGLGPWLREALGVDRLPTGLTLDAELESDAAGTLGGPIVLANQRSRLTLALSLGERGALEGTALSGEVSLMDVYELLPRGGLTIVGKGNVELQALIEGDVGAPTAAVKVALERPRLLVAGAGKGVRISLTRVLARLNVNLDRVLWSELVIDGYEGRLKSQGLFGWGSSGFRGLQAKVEIDDVRLGALPLPGEGKVGQLVSGRLNGSVSLSKKRGEGLTARGHVWVESPVYPVLRRAGPALGKYGLRPPPIAGTEPLIADLRGGPEGWLLRGISGSVRGASVDGDLALQPSGEILGALDVHLEAAYLRTSTLLHVPATMVGDLIIPVRLRGPFAAPEVEADLLGTFDHLVKKSALGRGIHRAVDRVMDGVFGDTPKGERQRYDVAEDAELLDDDVLFRRIARGIGDEEAYLDVLIDRGLDPDEIATRIEDARRR